jgi:hypothetical protein
MTMIPVDFERCQAEKPNGNSFMTMGGRPVRVRCDATPVWLATETQPGADGLCGAMSLCDSCKHVLEEQLPPGFAVCTAIEGKP